MKEILKFLKQIGILKGKKRRGWVLHKIKNPETTAEHIWHLLFLVYLIGRKKKMNLERALKMALIHDIGEVFAPDLTSYDAAGLEPQKRITPDNILRIKPKKGRPTMEQREILKKIKRKLERMAIKKLVKNLPEFLKKEILSLWEEFEENKTKEARFVKQCDHLINFLQGVEYWKKYGKIELPLWLVRAKEVIDDKDLLKILTEIEKEIKKKK